MAWYKSWLKGLKTKVKCMAECFFSCKSDIKEMNFSMAQCFCFDGSENDRRCAAALVKYFCEKTRKLALFGTPRFYRYFLKIAPELKCITAAVIDNDPRLQGTEVEGISIVSPADAARHADSVFLCNTNWRVLRQMRQELPSLTNVWTIDLLPKIDWKVIPLYGWVPKIQSIYPIEIPDIKFSKNKDVILLDFPARSLAQLPVGFGYIHDAIKRAGINSQTVDLDIIIYHRFHSDKILDGVSEVITTSGRSVPPDPWEPTHYLEWGKEDFVEMFRSDINEIVDKLVEAAPKILACSLQQVNLLFAKKVVTGVRQKLPELIVVVGGMSCLQADAAKMVFPEADYTVVHEGDLTIGPLLKSILAGEIPHDIPGVLSRHDSKGRTFTPGPVPMNLDELGHPRYEWTDLSLYRNWNGNSLVPIVGSRGCSWSRCRFCAENFLWRTRQPEKVVDDLEFFYKRGFKEFVFNESNLHGSPELIVRMCDEIIKRGIKIHMTAQLRCHIRTDRKYYNKLAAAGFVCLRFGVDGWSQHALGLQQKGYTKDMIKSNLKDATEAGIFTEVNMVIGVPGETDADVEEYIEFARENKPYIGRLPFVNPCMLFRGSEYWKSPEKYGIVFTVPQEELYSQYPVSLPDSAWFSQNPHIDSNVRNSRFLKVVKALHEIGIPTTAWSDFTTENVVKNSVDAADINNPKSKNSQSADCSNIADNLSEPGEGDVSARLPSDALIVSLPPSELKTSTAICRYRDYSVMRYRGLLYASPVLLGEINLENEKERDSLGIIVAENLARIKRSIDRALKTDGYIVFQSKHGFYGVPVNNDTMNVEDCVVMPKFNPSPFIKLVSSYKGYNIVLYDDCYLAVPLSFGPMDLRRKENLFRKGIFVALSELGAKEMIDVA